MKIKISITVLCFFLSINLFGQTNIKTSKEISSEILRGNYDAMMIESDNPLDLPEILTNEINADSLLNYLLCLEKFETRNSGSDTLSTTRGIGAARTWIYDRFQQMASQSPVNSQADYLEFDQVICDMDHHKNVILVHPGTNPEEEIIIVEAHMDSRCAVNCDIDCLANGIEDNGSGTALVIELARVMTQRVYNRTIVFMLTTAEEQGLHGADAMALFCVNENIDIKGVFNNDVIGGIICGETASPPGCQGLGDVDSTQVRIFSEGAAQSPHKSLARYTKMQYNERVKPNAEVPMTISIMSAEDRIGRGGDHIPFRERGFTAIRFTSANENGSAAIGPDYHDHQHTSKDILGIDTDNDNVIDSFFVDFNYLKRNTIINGLSIGMVANSPEAPEIELEQIGNMVKVLITSDHPEDNYKVGVRSNSNDFDSLYIANGTKEILVDAPEANTFFLVSASVIGENGVESCFSDEEFLLITTSNENITEIQKPKVQLLQNRPNPFDEATTISWYVSEKINYTDARLTVHNSKGILLTRKIIQLNEGMNDWVFTHGWGTEGVMYYSLHIDGNHIETKPMIFAY